MKITCPQCRANYEIEGLEPGRKVECPCSHKFIAEAMELEAVSTAPARRRIRWGTCTIFAILFGAIIAVASVYFNPEWASAVSTALAGESDVGTTEAVDEEDHNRVGSPNPVHDKVKVVDVPPETKFLMDFGVLGGFTTVQEKKKPIQLFFERLLREHPRKKAPGYWIDQLSTDKPAMKRDVLPKLPDKVVFGNLGAANAHWETFCKRNPQMAEILKEHIKDGRPILEEMPATPGTDPVKADGTVDFECHRKWVDNFVRDSRSGCPWSEVGAYALYVDFLVSRGGERAKAHAFQLNNCISSALNKHAWREVNRAGDEKRNAVRKEWATILKAYLLEITWPIFEFTPGKYDSDYFGEIVTSYMDDQGYSLEKRKKAERLFALNQRATVATLDILRPLREYALAFNDSKPRDITCYNADPDYLQAHKWFLKHCPVRDNNLMGRANVLQNGYGRAKDSLGLILMMHLSREKYDKGILSWLNHEFVKLCGKGKGEKEFSEYIKLVPEMLPTGKNEKKKKRQKRGS